MTRHGEFRDILLLLLLGTVWGGSFLLIKISVDTVPPLTIAAVRLAIAAVCLAALARALGQRLPDSLRGWSIYLAIGFFGNTLPFALIGYGEIHIDSGVAAILMAGVPLFTLVMAHYFVPGERTTVAKLAGISIGLSGIVVLVGVDALGGLGAQFIGQLTVLGAAFSYALVNIFASRISFFFNFRSKCVIYAG